MVVDVLALLEFAVAIALVDQIDLASLVGLIFVTVLVLLYADVVEAVDLPVQVDFDLVAVFDHEFSVLED